ncbi:MAG: methyl-accepting chemotaxis protein [Actinobacteria bacterium]|nr:methyl-accepting chemotaxis protein [Actinomycetota bacterium]
MIYPRGYGGQVAARLRAPAHATLTAGRIIGDTHRTTPRGWMHMSETRAREGGMRAQTLAIVSGAAVGAAFPAVATLLVEPRSTLALVVFWLLSIVAGISLGALCVGLLRRTAQDNLVAVLRQATTTLGYSQSAAQSEKEVKAELEHVFTSAANLLGQIRAAAENIRAVSAEVLAATEQQASGAAQQAAAVTETSATVEELAQTSSQIADNSESVVKIAEKTLASAEDGMTAVVATAAGIQEIRETTMQSSDRILALGERSQEIGRVLSIIDEIAEQTKILALNAAIEAARAGEAGKGFSVVAEEIRKLADSVTESTNEIGRVVREIQASASALIMQTEKAAARVAEGEALAQNTAASLERIVNQVEQTTDAAKQISIATQQQRTASDQVVLSMREVAQVSQQAAEASRKITAAITELSRLADSLVSH